MPMVRCPQCGRVADGRSCFACGYEWPAGGAAAPAAAPAPVPAARTGPFASPLAPPRAPTPHTGNTGVTQATGNLQRSMPPPPTTNPFASAPSFTPPPRSSPFAQAPRSQVAPTPYSQPPMPPPPDEIVIDTDLEFSLMKEAIPPTLGGMAGALPLPPGLPPPPMPAFPAPPPGLPPPPFASPLAPPSQDILDTIFEGIDINVPMSPSQMSDPALEAGDFMIDSGPAEEAQESSSSSDAGADWAASSALGADLLAAFNASGGEEPPLVMVDEAPPRTQTPPPVEVSFEDEEVPLTQRLSVLAGRLRAEGRLEDANLVTEAMATINLG